MIQRTKLHPVFKEAKRREFEAGNKGEEFNESDWQYLADVYHSIPEMDRWRHKCQIDQTALEKDFHCLSKKLKYAKERIKAELKDNVNQNKERIMSVSSNFQRQLEQHTASATLVIQKVYQQFKDMLNVTESYVQSQVYSKSEVLRQQNDFQKLISSPAHRIYVLDLANNELA